MPRGNQYFVPNHVWHDTVQGRSSESHLLFFDMNRLLLLGLLAATLTTLPTCMTGTSLHKAVSNGDVAAVQAMLRSGVNETRGTAGVTPLMIAAENGHTEIVRLLLDDGADVDATTGPGGPQAALTVPGVTALMRAAWNGHPEVARLLIERGADVNARESQGHTALMMAAKGGHTDTVGILLEHGADINARYPLGITALMYAAANNYVETVRLLLDQGADVNANSALGETALIKALKHGDPDIELVKLLVAARHRYQRCNKRRKDRLEPRHRQEARGRGRVLETGWSSIER